jgi:hypothetical protein
MDLGGALVGATDAERQRRYRAHKRGDHSLCDPSRCSALDGVTVTRSVTVVTRDVALGDRGRRLWRDMSGDERTGADRVQLEEACRLADRLDRLDGILSGEPGEWMRFRVSEDGAEVTVTLDKALDQARQYAVALTQVLAKLGQGKSDDKPEEGKGASILDQLAARRAARVANPAG